jgi:hypothetical protein
MFRALLLISAILIAGCAHVVQPTTAPSTEPTTEPTTRPHEIIDLLLPPTQPSRLTLWQITVPVGGIRDNTAFWSQIDPTVVNARTGELLAKNGIRVGRASASDWPQVMRSLVHEHAKSRQMMYSGRPSQTVELEIQKDIASQTIFCFDPTDHLTGQTYDQSDDLFSITFEPSPSGSRVSLYPLIRSQRTIVQYTPRNNQEEISYVHPERMYDCNLTADLPPDKLLVIGASSDAARPTSLGHAFLVHDEPDHQYESLLLVLPADFKFPAIPPAQRH